MTDDPAVRSVRVAVALGDRFAELLKGPTQVKAVKQNNALFGVAGNEEGLSMRIGEVQQIYPEIWRHLDDARTAFAARGIDVSAYDAIRAAEGTALGAAPDLDRTEHGFGQYGASETVKSANFNTVGYQRAVQASRALMIATPEIDWQAIAKAEADDPNIKAFTRSTTTKRYVMIGLLAAVIAAPFVYVWNAKRERRARFEAATAPAREVSAGDRAKIEKLVTDARARFVPATAAWDAAFAPEALATLKASEKPCPFQFPAPTPATAEKFVKYASVEAGYGPAFASFGPGQTVLNQLVRATAPLDRLANATLAEAERVVTQLPAHVLVVVVDKDVAPKPGSGTTFEPGQLAARAFVYAVADRRIACTAAIDVANTPNLATPPNDEQAEETLFRELEVKLRQALATNLRAI